MHNLLDRKGKVEHGEKGRSERERERRIERRYRLNDHGVDLRREKLVRCFTQSEDGGRPGLV